MNRQGQAKNDLHNYRCKIILKSIYSMEHDCDISKKAGKNKSRDLTQERLWAVYVGEESSHLVDSSTQRSCCNGALKDPSILCLHAQMVIHRRPMNLAISLPCNCAKKQLLH